MLPNCPLIPRAETAFLTADREAKPTVPEAYRTAAPQVRQAVPAVRRTAVPAASQDPVFLRWDFINGLFLGILVLEFVIFPILFWMWFGPGSQRVDAVEKETSEN